MKFQLEFIEHTIVLACLTLMPTVTRAAWESNLLSYPQKRDTSKVFQPLGQGGASLTEAVGNILKNYLTVVHWVKNHE